MRRPDSPEFDPFVAPSTVPVSSVRARDRAAVAGTVSALEVGAWAAGVRALHATVTDETGSLTVAFLGRTRIAGVDLGTPVVIGGTAMSRCGCLIMMNPRLWLPGSQPRLQNVPAQERRLAHV